MVASSRFPTTVQRGGLVKRTLLYVASFGLGSLLIAGVLSLVLVSLAEGVLPSRDSSEASTDTDAPGATVKPVVKPPARKLPSSRRPGRPARRPTGASGLRGSPAAGDPQGARPTTPPKSGPRHSAELRAPSPDPPQGSAVPL